MKCSTCGRWLEEAEAADGSRCDVCELARVRAHVAELEAEGDKLRSGVRAYDKCFTDAMTEVKRLRARVAELESRIQASEQRNRNLLAKVREQDDDVDKANARVAELERALKSDHDAHAAQLGAIADTLGAPVAEDAMGAAERVVAERDRLREVMEEQADCAESAASNAQVWNGCYDSVMSVVAALRAALGGEK